MKKLRLLIALYLGVYFLSFSNAFASQNDLNQGRENLGIITNFFTFSLLLNIIFAIIVVIVTFFVAKIVSFKLSSYLEKNANGENREELVGVLSRTTNIAVLSVGAAITLGILGIDMGIFLAGLGFGIGFTLKIFLSNFVSGIIMVTQGTYHNGDLIEIGTKMGRIHRIHSLYTAVKQFDGVIINVPNIKFLEENVSNYTTNSTRRLQVSVAVDYSSDLVKAKKIMLQVIGQFPNILNAPEPKVTVDKLDNSSVNLIVRFWLPSTDGEFLVTRSNVTETIHMAFKNAGIKVAFPQITISNRENVNPFSA